MNPSSFSPRPLRTLLLLAAACFLGAGKLPAQTPDYQLTGDGLFYFEGALKVDSDSLISYYISEGVATAIPATTNLLGTSFTFEISGGAYGSELWHWDDGTPITPGEIVTLDNGYAFAFTSTAWSVRFGGQGGTGGGHRSAGYDSYYTVTITTVPQLAVPPTGTISSPSYVRGGSQVTVSFQVSPGT